MQTILKRYMYCATMAGAVTGTLVLIMHYAIQTEDVEIVERPPIYVDSAFPDRDEPEPRRKQPPKKPEPPKLPPPTEVPQFALVETGNGIPGPTPPPKDPGVIPTPGAAEGDLLPIMTVPPEYPDRMAARGTEGWVIVEFTVDELGRVIDPRVIDAYPSRGFDKAALRAVMRYKYKPRVIDGSAVPVHGVRQRIVFSMGQA